MIFDYDCLLIKFRYNTKNYIFIYILYKYKTKAKIYWQILKHSLKSTTWNNKNQNVKIRKIIRFEDKEKNSGEKHTLKFI